MQSPPSTKITPEVLSFLENRSLLGILVTPELLPNILRTYPLRRADAGTKLFAEGEGASQLIIVVSGSIRLLSESPGAEPVETGLLGEGRSANLYSLVRGLPYQYSGVAAEETTYLSIPWRYFSPLLKLSPAIEPYLKAITGDPVVRALAREITDIGCSRKFRVELLGRIQASELGSHDWVCRQDRVPEAAFMVVSGAVLSYRNRADGKAASLIPVPGRAWIAWKEALEGKMAAFSYRSAGTARILGVSADALRDLRDRFPEDMAIYGEWTGKAVSPEAPSEDAGEREDAEISELFSEEPKRSWKARFAYPWIRQENEMDCGPACLAMVSKFFENEIPIQYWRSQIYTNRQGTTLFDLAKGAERNGFDTHGLYVEDLKELEASLFPVIAVRRYHFVVVYAMTDEHVIIGDPATGIRKLGLPEFHDGFERAVMLLRPTEAFHRTEAPLVGNRHYLRLFQGYSRELALVVACAVLGVLLSLFPPFFMQIVMDEVLVKKDAPLLVYALAMTAFVAVLQGGIGWIKAYYTAYVTAKFDFRAQSSFLRKMFSLPYAYFANRHIGDFTRRLAEMARLREFVTSTALSTFLSLLTLVVYGIVLAIYSPLIALLTFLIAPVLVGISMLFSRKLQASYMEAFANKADEESLLNDLIRGVPTVKALTAEVASRWRLEERIIKTLKSRYSFTMTAATLTSISEFYGQVSRLFLMGIAANIAIKGEMSPGQIVSISVFVNYVINPFYDLARTWSGIQETKSAMTRLNDVFLSPSEKGPKAGALSKPRLRGEIEFQDVWFRYGGDSTDWVLKGISFRIEPGQKIAIAGPSGSGKSTIASLLLRMFEPTRGQILIDGRDYRDYDLEWLRSQVGLILQESHLFNGTLLQNVAFGDPNPDEKKIQRSAEMANAHGFIAKKPGGYAYVVSHGGHGLSGGEKQRIACARAFYLDPPILILDEATSALDGVAEKELIEGLLEASKDRAVLSIAHRFTTARYFDTVLLLNAGRIVGFGPHHALERQSELYRALFGLDRTEAA